MPNFAGVLKEEISRIARRQSRSVGAVLKKKSAQHRRDIAGLKRHVRDLLRRLGFLEKQEKKRYAQRAPREAAEGRRFSARWVKAHRSKLGLSAADYAKLVGVTPLTVYHWEHGKSKPRQQQLAAWSAVRGLGKREAQRRLEMIAARR